MFLTGCAAGTNQGTTTGAGPNDASRDAGSGMDSGAESGGQGPDLGLPPCDVETDEDRDRDGLSVAQGDCYDCDARIGPGAFDVPDNGIDDDCSGNQATGAGDTCDQGLALTSFDAKDGARAIGLCNFLDAGDAAWGVLRAAYVNADGSRALSAAEDEDDHVGLLSSFGPESPRAGESLLALSTGIARAPGQPGYEGKCGAYYTIGTDGWPSDYPRTSPACGGGGGGGAPPLLQDPAALEIELRVPTNAKGFSFETNFYTYEYPDYICSEYNDYFLVLMDPPPADHPDGNLVFDADGNWISVNNGLLQACTPGTHQGKTFKCPLGTLPLKDTGYDADDTLCGEGASTGWLRTVVPVQPGSTIRLRFTVWDTADPNRDSTVLIDHFKWDLDAPKAIETQII